MHDYHSMTIDFKLNSKKRVWIAINAKDVKFYKALTFEKLCRVGTSCYAILVSTKGKSHELPEENQAERGLNV